MSSTPTLHCDTLIVGAGVIGSSVAMHLAEMGAKDICALDLDLEGRLSSSELNAGGVRGTWLEPLNARLSQDSIDFFSKTASEIGYRDCGYLWLFLPSRGAQAEAVLASSRLSGWPVEEWSIAELKAKAPFIDKTEDVGAVTFAPRDGLLNPNLLKLFYRNRARAQGVRFEDRAWLESAQILPTEVRLVVRKAIVPLDHEVVKSVLTGNGGCKGFDTLNVVANRVVNCAGSWAACVAKILGYESPARPVRRQICIFDCKAVDLSPYGMIVDTSGVYFHPEATNGLAGFANAEEPEGFNFEYDDDNFFVNVIWPALYERSTAFEKLKHITGWAGLYEVSPDGSAIIGVVSNSRCGVKLFEAHSFSGRGVMQSYSAGRGLAELMTTGKYQTLDLSPMRGSRFVEGKVIHEALVI